MLSRRTGVVLSRRGLLLGALSAPVVVKAASLMVIRKPLILPRRVGVITHTTRGPGWEVERVHTVLREGDVVETVPGVYSVELSSLELAGEYTVRLDEGLSALVDARPSLVERPAAILSKVWQPSGLQPAFTVLSTKRKW